MPKIDLSAIGTLARQAGDIALRHFRNVEPEHKSDRTVVTVADREIEEFLRKELSAAWPESVVLGEEFGGFEDARTRPLAWVLDPLDGTVAYSMGLPVWAVSIGLLEEGRPIAGVVYVPLIDEMYSAASGRGATFNGRPVRMADPLEVDPDDFLAVPSIIHRQFRVRFPGKVRSFGSTAAHMALVARGTAWGGVLERVSLWDIAAGAVIVAEAGGRLEYSDGSPVDFGALMDGQPLPGCVFLGSPPRLERMRDWIDVLP